MSGALGESLSRFTHRHRSPTTVSGKSGISQPPQMLSRHVPTMSRRAARAVVDSSFVLHTRVKANCIACLASDWAGRSTPISTTHAARKGIDHRTLLTPVSAVVLCVSNASAQRTVQSRRARRLAARFPAEPAARGADRHHPPLVRTSPRRGLPRPGSPERRIEDLRQFFSGCAMNGHVQRGWGPPLPRPKTRITVLCAPAFGRECQSGG